MERSSRSEGNAEGRAVAQGATGRSSVALDSQNRLLRGAEPFFLPDELGPRPRRSRSHPKEVLDQDQFLKQRYLELVERERVLSAERLRSHIWRNHPKQIDPEEEEYTSWSYCQNVGSLFGNTCCIKRKVTPFTKSLGIGPSLFLVSLKSYIRLFLALSVLCIPACIVLSSGAHGDSLDLGGGLTASFARASLGNLGY